MESSHEETDADEGDEDGDKARDHQIGSPSSPPPYGEPVVYENGVDDPRDEGPRFLGVPVPIGAPGKLGPKGPGNDAEGEKGKPEGHAFVIDAVEGIE